MRRRCGRTRSRRFPRPSRIRASASPSTSAAGPDEAIAHFQQALRVNPRLAHAENNWGITLAKQGRWEEAARHYEAALRIDRRHAEAHANLAVALGRLGRYADAQRHLEQARAIVLSRTR